MDKFSPILRPTLWRRKNVDIERRCKWGRSLWLSVTFAVIMAASFTSADEKEDKSVLLVDMTDANLEKSKADFIHGISLRLPDWDVKQVDRGSDAFKACEQGTSPHHILHIETTEDGHIIGTLSACGETTPIFHERMEGGEAESETLRKIAVLTPMALDSDDTPTQGERPEQTAKDDTDKKAQPLGARERIKGTLGLLPGVTIAPTQKSAVFTGSGAMGVLLTNGLTIRFSVDGKTPYEGIAEKNNPAKSEQTRVRVTDLGFGLSVLYRLELRSRWYTEFGAGLKYVHSFIREISEEKYKVDNPSPASRGAAWAHIAAGAMLRSYLSLFIELFPTLFFGRRVYKVRGEDAVDLGWGTVGVGIGIRFYL